MNKRRLLKLAALLEADADDPNGIQFDLEYWASRVDKDEFPARLEKLDCNTKACAVGLACLSGVFKKEGLTWKSSREENNIEPIFNGRRGFGAAKDFFGLEHEPFCFLFVDSYYDYGERKGAPGERLVAQRIRDFVAGKVSP